MSQEEAKRKRLETNIRKYGSYEAYKKEMGRRAAKAAATRTKPSGFAYAAKVDPEAHRAMSIRASKLGVSKRREKLRATKKTDETNGVQENGLQAETSESQEA